MQWAFGAWGLGIWGSGFRVFNLGFGVLGLVCRVKDLYVFLPRGPIVVLFWGLR